MSFYNKKHTLAQELNEVHQQMYKAYKLEQEGQSDAVKAIQMEQYLRTFKALGDWYRQDSTRPAFQTQIDDLAMEAIALEVGQRMGLGQQQGNSLFRWYHAAQRNNQSQWNVDDVFEAELKYLLQIAAEEAVGKMGVNIYSGAEAVGGQLGNIPDKIVQAIGDKKVIPKAVQNSVHESRLTKKPKLESIKTDVKGYSQTFALRADIKEEWRDFINLFTGANFSVKNYAGNNQYLTISLGNSLPSRSIPASLFYSGYDDEAEVAHIYYHIVKSDERKGGLSDTNSAHVLHLRFAYELAGGGLVDKDGVPLDTVDFLIWNDPASPNVYVRSTKQLIAKAMESLEPVKNALYTKVAILKSDFS